MPPSARICLASGGMGLKEIYSPFDLFFRMIKRGISRFVPRKKNNRIRNVSHNENIVERIKSRAFPSVHGAYVSHLEEIIKSFPSRWIKMFKFHGFQILKTFTIRFIPFENRMSIALFEKSSGITYILGKLNPLKYFGVHFCILAKKP